MSSICGNKASKLYLLHRYEELRDHTVRTHVIECCHDCFRELRRTFPANLAGTPLVQKIVEKGPGVCRLNRRIAGIE